MRTHVMRLSAAHKTVTELQIVDGMLGKQGPTIDLIVTCRLLGWVWTGVSNVPHVPMETSRVHSLSHTGNARGRELWHLVAVEPPDALELMAIEGEASE